MKDKYGLIGEKLPHSISPLVHNLIFKKLNIDAEYKLYEIERHKLGSALKDFSDLGFKGLNVTIPYKVSVMEFLDEIDENSQKIGSCNTISFKNGKLLGFNTDYMGFSSMLSRNDIEISNSKILMLGTGGAARMVYRVLKDNNAKKVLVASRNIENAVLNWSCNINLNDAEFINYGDLTKLKNYDTIINCTPCGMFPDLNSSPVQMDVLKNFRSAVDLIYNPSKTLFLKEAESFGLKTVNGLFMLIAQAVYAESIFNGFKPDSNFIEDIYNQVLK